MEACIFCLWVFHITLAWVAVILLEINQPLKGGVWNEFATSPRGYSIFKIKEVKLSLVCCWVEDTKALVPFLPGFISAMAEDVASRKAFPGGSMQLFMCGNVHKDNHPEHRHICRDLTSFNSSLVKTVLQRIRHVNGVFAWRDIYGGTAPIAIMTVSPPQPWWWDVHQLFQDTTPLCWFPYNASPCLMLTPPGIPERAHLC